jgi:hypothetical protein
MSIKIIAAAMLVSLFSVGPACAEDVATDSVKNWNNMLMTARAGCGLLVDHAGRMSAKLVPEISDPIFVNSVCGCAVNAMDKSGQIDKLTRAQATLPAEKAERDFQAILLASTQICMGRSILVIYGSDPSGRPKDAQP